MEDPRYWDGYAYPEEERKVWIGFSKVDNGSVVAFISESRPIETYSKGAAVIEVCSALRGSWQSREEAVSAANAEADRLIEKYGL